MKTRILNYPGYIDYFNSLTIISEFILNNHKSEFKVKENNITLSAYINENTNDFIIDINTNLSNDSNNPSIFEYRLVFKNHRVVKEIEFIYNNIHHSTLSLFINNNNETIIYKYNDIANINRINDIHSTLNIIYYLHNIIDENISDDIYAMSRNIIDYMKFIYIFEASNSPHLITKDYMDINEDHAHTIKYKNYIIDINYGKFNDIINIYNINDKSNYITIFSNNEKLNIYMNNYENNSLLLRDYINNNFHVYKLDKFKLRKIYYLLSDLYNDIFEPMYMKFNKILYDKNNEENKSYFDNFNKVLDL